MLLAQGRYNYGHVSAINTYKSKISLFTTWSRLLTNLKEKILVNIVGKGENPGNQHFLLLPQWFLSFQKQVFFLPYANSFSLNKSKLLFALGWYWAFNSLAKDKILKSAKLNLYLIGERTLWEKKGKFYLPGFSPFPTMFSKAHVFMITLDCMVRSLRCNPEFNSFPKNPWFSRVRNRSLLKTLWEKEKMLVWLPAFSPFRIMFSTQS